MDWKAKRWIEKQVDIDVPPHALKIENYHVIVVEQDKALSWKHCDWINIRWYYHQHDWFYLQMGILGVKKWMCSKKI